MVNAVQIIKQFRKVYNKLTKNEKITLVKEIQVISTYEADL